MLGLHIELMGVNSHTRGEHTREVSVKRNFYSNLVFCDIVKGILPKIGEGKIDLYFLTKRKRRKVEDRMDVDLWLTIK